MNQDPIIVINTQEFAEQYLMFLENNLRLMELRKAPRSTINLQLKEIEKFEDADRSINEGILFMQKYALDRLDKVNSEMVNMLNRLEIKANEGR